MEEEKKEEQGSIASADFLYTYIMKVVSLLFFRFWKKKLMKINYKSTCLKKKYISAHTQREHHAQKSSSKQRKNNNDWLN
jgi:hypothetical protein